MTKMLLFIAAIILILNISTLYSQSFTWQVDTTAKIGTPLEHFEYHSYLFNNTGNMLRLRIIRTLNQIPNGWSSSLCVGTLCYAPFTDTVYADIAGNSNDSLILHVDTSSDPTVGTVDLRVENTADTSNNQTQTFITSTGPPVGITSPDGLLTGQYQLYKNYPNPFNPVTNIPFEVGNSYSRRIMISVYNIIGQRIRVLLDGNLQPGSYRVTWDGNDDRGIAVSSGLYIYELRTQYDVLMGKMILLK